MAMDMVTRHNPDMTASSNNIHDWIIANRLNPEATQCLLNCDPDIQQKVIMRGSCDPRKVRDQVAVIKKRIQDISRGVATGIYCREVEDFIAAHGFDEKAKDVLRTAAPQVQRVVLDRGPCTEAKNASAVILVRVRDAQRAAQGHYMDGRGQKLPGMPAGHFGTSLGPTTGAKRTAAQLESEAGVPVVTWLTFDPSTPLVQQGFPADVPCMLYTKSINLFSSGEDILREILANVNDAKSLDIVHDEEWKKFPGVGEAFKKATGEENCFAVATCREFGKWAVGFHAGWKGRDAAAKLALAVSIVSGSPQEEKIARLFPDFSILLDEVAISREIGKKPNLAPAAPSKWDEGPPQFTGPPPAFAGPAPTVGARPGGQMANHQAISLADAASAAQAAIFDPANKPPPLPAPAPPPSLSPPPAMLGLGPPPMMPPPSNSMQSPAEAAKSASSWWEQMKQSMGGAPTPSKMSWPELEPEPPLPPPPPMNPNLPPTPGMMSQMQPAPASATSARGLGGPTPPVNSISIPPTSSICGMGFPAEAPAMIFEKAHNADFFSQASSILSNLLGDVMTVDIQHDDAWKKFPEIASSLRPSGIKESSFAVAMCPDLGKWALGVDGAWKNREATAKLALCMAIATDSPHFQQTMINYPMFHKLCVDVGLVVSG